MYTHTQIHTCTSTLCKQVERKKEKVGLGVGHVVRPLHSSAHTHTYTHAHAYTYINTHNYILARTLTPYLWVT
jgi:hypothetical protein